MILYFLIKPRLFHNSINTKMVNNKANAEEEHFNIFD